MAGEISKKIGERGEEVVEKIFSEIFGYKNISTGIKLDCFKGKDHKIGKTKSDRKSHGLDGLIGDVSELSNRTLDIGYISVKHTEKVGYRKTDFGGHIRDIAYGMECFKKSKVLSDFKKNLSGVKDFDLIGILVWVSDLDDLYQSVQSYVEEYNIPAGLDFDQIIVIDNKKISFFIDTVLNDKTTFGSENVNFVYHNSGLNPALQSYYGSKLPIYYLYSDIIVTRVQSKQNIILKFFYSEEFDTEVFRGMIDLAIEYDKLDSIDKIEFSFKNYVKSQSQDMVSEILLQYEGYINSDKIETIGHFQSLKNL